MHKFGLLVISEDLFLSRIDLMTVLQWCTVQEIWWHFLVKWWKLPHQEKKWILEQPSFYTKPTRTGALNNGLRRRAQVRKTCGYEHIVRWAGNVSQLFPINLCSNTKRVHSDVFVLESACCFWRLCVRPAICCLLTVSDQNCDLKQWKQVVKRLCLRKSNLHIALEMLDISCKPLNGGYIYRRIPSLVL